MAATVVSQTGIVTARVVSPPLSPAWRIGMGALISAGPVEVTTQDFHTVALGLTGRGVGKKIVAQTGRVTLSAGTWADAARRVAQNGRLTCGLGGLGEFTASSVAGSFSHITITRDYDLATGAAPTGVVYFTPSAWMVNNGVTVPAATCAAPLDTVGQITISLAANTDPGTTPPGTHYVVREEIVGQPRHIYTVIIPYDSGAAIDLSTLPVL